MLSFDKSAMRSLEFFRSVNDGAGRRSTFVTFTVHCDSFVFHVGSSRDHSPSQSCRHDNGRLRFARKHGHAICNIYAATLD